MEPELSLDPRDCAESFAAIHGTYGVDDQAVVEESVVDLCKSFGSTELLLEHIDRKATKQNEKK